MQAFILQMPAHRLPTHTHPESPLFSEARRAALHTGFAEPTSLIARPFCGVVIQVAGMCVCVCVRSRIMPLSARFAVGRAVRCELIRGPTTIIE